MFRPFRTWLRLYGDALRGLPRATWRLAIATLVQRGFTMVVAFSTLYLNEELGFTVAESTTLLALFGLGGVAGSLAGGAATERFGPWPVQILSLCTTAIGFFVYTGFESWNAVATLLVLLGFSTGAYRPAATTMLTASVPPEQRAQAFAFFRLAINLGWALGPSFGGMVAEYDFDLVFLIDGVGCLVTAGLTAVWLRGVGTPARRPHGDSETRTADEPNDEPRRSPWSDGPVLILIANTMITAIVVMQWVNVGTLYFVNEYAMSKAELGFVLAINPVLIVLLEPAIVQAIRGRPPLGWISLAVGCVALSTFLVPLGSSIPWAVLALVLWTFGEMVESPLAGAFVAERAGTRNMGRYMGLYTASWSVAAVLAPWAGGQLYDRFGGTTLWLTFAAAATVCSTTLAILAVRDRNARRQAASRGTS